MNFHQFWKYKYLYDPVHGSVARIREGTNSTSTGHEKCIQNFSWRAWRERELGNTGAGQKILFKKPLRQWPIQLLIRPTDRFLWTTGSVQIWELLDQPSDQQHYTERLDLFVLLTTTVHWQKVFHSLFSAVTFSLISTSKLYRNKHRLGTNGMSVTYVAFMTYIRFHA